MLLQVVTPKGQVVEEEIDQVIVPGVEGEFGVLPGHIPFLSAVRPGVLTYSARGTTRRVAVAGGLADVGAHERIVVLVEDACKPDDVDATRLRDEQSKLQQQLQQWDKPIAGADTKPDPGYQLLADRLRWIEAQLQLA